MSKKFWEGAIVGGMLGAAFASWLVYGWAAKRFDELAHVVGAAPLGDPNRGTVLR